MAKKKKAKRRPKKRATKKAKRRPKKKAKRAKARPKKRKAKPKKRAKAKKKSKKKAKKRSKARPKKRAKRAKKKLKKHAKSRFKKAKKRLKAARNKVKPRKPLKAIVVRTAEGYVLDETVKSKSKFDPDSFRTIKPRAGVVLTIGCPKGKWDKDKQVCRVGTQLQNKKKAISATEAARLRGRGAKSASNRSNLVQKLLNRARHGKVSQRPKLLPGRKARVVGKKNFLLMTVTNPATKAQLHRAKRAFRGWHLKGPSFATTVKVPDSYPSTMINLGQLEAFNYKTPSGQTRRWECPTGNKPTLASNAEGTRAYALGGDFKGLPAGSRMTMVHYRIPLPPRSNRVKLGSRRWYHPFDSAPVIHVNTTGGFWLSTPVKPEGFSG